MTPSAEIDAPGTGPFYVYDDATITRAAAHGCLDEDVETGDPIACAACVIPPGQGADDTPGTLE